MKYILRSLFSIIFFLLFVGWAKMNRDANAYISFLNTNDRSIFHRSQPATWTEPFWPSHSSGSLADMLSGDISAVENSGLDSINPEFEKDINSLPDTSLSGSTGEDFGFTPDGQASSGVTTSSETTSKVDLLNAIKQSAAK